MSAAFNPSDWIDGGSIPPRRLPAEIDAALAYVADALGHIVYTRWTLATVRRQYPSLADAKTFHPAVIRLLLDHRAVIEYWDRGRVRTVPADDAPTEQTVLQRVLHTHRRRFRLAAADGVPATTGEPVQEARCGESSGGLAALAATRLCACARRRREGAAASRAGAAGSRVHTNDGCLRENRHDPVARIREPDLYEAVDRESAPRASAGAGAVRRKWDAGIQAWHESLRVVSNRKIEGATQIDAFE